MGLSLDIQVDGASSAELGGRWRALTVVDGIDYQADSATLSLTVPPALEIEIPPLGAELRFAADGQSLGGPLHATAIRGDNRAGSVTVEAGALHPRTTLREERIASWSGQSIAQIATAIAQRAGLVPAISATLGSKVPAGAIQSDESDMMFLRRLVARWSGRVVHKDGRLAVLPADETKSASGAPLPPVEIDLRATGAWVRWRRSETAIVDIVQATHLEEDGATPARLTLGDLPQGRRPQRRKLPGVFASVDDAGAAIRRVLASARSGFDYIEIGTSLLPAARALYPVELSGVPKGFPTRLTIHQVRHELGRRVATTTVTARP
ncbi:MAG: contractile injection system protein, VgrG/Pvc8 family [Rhodospirillaceae bacterium]|nr:contractile injection system protein, VgrG/Pvc8 family [Rhodospirillaceae bacterium]